MVEGAAPPVIWESEIFQLSNSLSDIYIPLGIKNRRLRSQVNPRSTFGLSFHLSYFDNHRTIMVRVERIHEQKCLQCNRQKIIILIVFVLLALCWYNICIVVFASEENHICIDKDGSGNYIGNRNNQKTK